MKSQRWSGVQGRCWDEVWAHQVDSYINDNGAVMFSFSKCPFCVKAKKEFDEMGVDWGAQSDPSPGVSAIHFEPGRTGARFQVEAQRF